MLKRIGAVAGVVVALWAVSHGLSTVLDPYALQIAVEVGIAIILAVSLNLINGFTGQFSLGHAGFAAVGAYVAAAVTFYLSPQWVAALAARGIGAGVAATLVLLAALAVSAVAAAGAGLLVGLPSLRLRGDYLAIATLGFGEIIRLVINNWSHVGGAAGFIPPQPMPRLVNLFWVWLFVGAVIAVSTNLLRSAHGRALLSIREDELAAQVMGVPTTAYKVTAFVIGAAFAGVAGCLTAHYNLALHPNDFDLIASVMIVVMVVLGGMGSVTGVALAAVLLTLLSYLLRSPHGLMAGCFLVGGVLVGLTLSGRRLAALGKGTIATALLLALAFGVLRAQPFLQARLAELRMLLFSVLLIVLMLARPQGLLGSWGISWHGLARLTSTRRRRPGDGTA